MADIVPDTTSQTFRAFQEGVVGILISLDENHNPETVATTLTSQLHMNYEQGGIGTGTAFLAWNYWATVKRGLDAHGAETSESDPCKFSREVTLAQELKKAGYSVEETIAIIKKIREKVTAQRTARQTADQVHMLVTATAV